MSLTTNRHWLNIAEYVSLAGSVAGSVAAVASQQMVYAAAPLTLALSLSLANRQRLHQMQGQQISSVITDVRQKEIAQIQGHLDALTRCLDNLPGVEQAIAAIQNRLATLEAPEILAISDRVVQLQTDVRSHQLQIDRFAQQPNDQQNQKLDQAVEQLQQRFQIVSLLASEISKLKQQQRVLGQRLENLQTPQQLEEIRLLTTDFKETTAVLNERQMQQMQQQQQLASLQQFVTGYVKSEDLESALGKLREEFSGRVDAAVERRVAEINRLLKKIQPAYEYELVFDRSGSRSVLLEALQKAQHRLILVCPWLSCYGADFQVIQKCKALLVNGARLELGWGNLKDINNGNLGTGFMYNALGAFEKLSKNYPKQCQMKILGTHEKFLVCDRSFAMLGSHNFLTSGTSSSEREVGLRTNDPRIISDLISRFENAAKIDLIQEQNRSLSYA